MNEEGNLQVLRQNRADVSAEVLCQDSLVSNEFSF